MTGWGSMRAVAEVYRKAYRLRIVTTPGQLTVLKSYTLCNFEQQGEFPFAIKTTRRGKTPARLP